MSPQKRDVISRWADRVGLATIAFFAVMTITKVDALADKVSNVQQEVSSIKTAVEYGNKRVDFVNDRVDWLYEHR